MDENPDQHPPLKQQFNFASGLKTMALGPCDITGGLFLTFCGIMVTAISSVYAQTQADLLVQGCNLTGKGFADLFWRGPRAMALSLLPQKPKLPEPAP